MKNNVLMSYSNNAKREDTLTAFLSYVLVFFATPAHETLNGARVPSPATPREREKQSASRTQHQRERYSPQ